mmetsp:Transcript_28777/g.56225  ORF Transcript_28777/g.56225 Transcript_28777/m.56225 type:complete len:215 (+) Transcript_28777:113-757(+)
MQTLHRRALLAEKCLVVQLHEHGRPTLDPVALRLVRGQDDRAHVVGRVPCRSEHAPPCRRVVDGTDVVANTLRPQVLVERLGLPRDVWGRLLFRVEPHDRHSAEEHLGLRLVEDFSVLVPSPRLAEETVDVDAVLRGGWVIGLGHQMVFEVEGIDGEGVLASEVLHASRHEGVHEEEARHPKHRRLALVDPLLKECKPREKVGDEASERLEGGV